MTDAGLGVMLLYPFSEERIFLPWRPFYAPPIKFSSISYEKVQMMIRSELPIVFSCLAVGGTIRLMLWFISSKKASENIQLPNMEDE
jgi:hypothetical protein